MDDWTENWVPSQCPRCSDWLTPTHDCSRLSKVERWERRTENLLGASRYGLRYGLVSVVFLVALFGPLIFHWPAFWLMWWGGTAVLLVMTVVLGKLRDPHWGKPWGFPPTKGGTYGGNSLDQ